MQDFSMKGYEAFLRAVQETPYEILSLDSYMKRRNPDGKFLIMRHDLDRSPKHALHSARIENRLGVSVVYYVRSKNGSFDADTVTRLVELGHEVGYHYETLARCNGDMKTAYDRFVDELTLLRKLCEVTTITMHGSPMSAWDNRLIWKEYNHHELGLVCEPYFDLDFTKMLYITDAGRKWNDPKVNRRDRVESQFEIPINSLREIADKLSKGELPNHIMVNIHSNNWSLNAFDHARIGFWQSTKNIIKRIIIRRDDK